MIDEQLLNTGHVPTLLSQISSPYFHCRVRSLYPTSTTGCRVKLTRTTTVMISRLKTLRPTSRPSKSRLKMSRKDHKNLINTNVLKTVTIQHKNRPMSGLPARSENDPKTLKSAKQRAMCLTPCKSTSTTDSILVVQPETRTN